MQCKFYRLLYLSQANQKARFKHFEQLADVQMLAMLSCIFAEPVMKKATPYAMMDMSLRVCYRSGFKNLEIC